MKYIVTNFENSFFTIALQNFSCRNRDGAFSKKYKAFGWKFDLFERLTGEMDSFLMFTVQTWIYNINNLIKDGIRTKMCYEGGNGGKSLKHFYCKRGEREESEIWSYYMFTAIFYKIINNWLYLLKTTIALFFTFKNIFSKRLRKSYLSWEGTSSKKKIQVQCQSGEKKIEKKERYLGFETRTRNLQI